MNASTPPTHVRAAHSADVTRLLEMQEEWEAEEVTHGYRAESRDALEARLGPYFLVGERSGRIAGYAYGAVKISDGSPLLEREVPYLEIEDLFVSAARVA